MGEIRQLDGHLVDMIAAGEVVERPASVVKELLENAFDAGAKRVQVEVAGGGIELVRVTDDGSGMDRSNAKLSLRRYATSKIRRVEDLLSIESLGFRGEALAAICSVSRFKLSTRPREQAVGTVVTAAGEGPTEVCETGCAPGASVEVRDLFFNIPARRKFLKSATTESAQITDTVTRAALSRPTVGLTLIRNGRTVRVFSPAQDDFERAQQVFHGERLLPVDTDSAELKLRAALTSADRARAGSTSLHLLVNGRPVRDRGLARAVAFAYGESLRPGHYPLGVVHIDLKPDAVDVNVHPQKTEVRFQRSRDIYATVTRLLADVLAPTVISRPEQLNRRRNANLDDPSQPARPYPMSGEGAAWGGSIENVLREQREEEHYRALSTLQNARETTAAVDQSGAQAADTRTAPAVGTPSPVLRLLGAARSTYMVCEGQEGICVLDPHAADERVRFGRLSRRHAAGGLSAQRLLIPARMDCSVDDANLVARHEGTLAAVGLECSCVATTTVVVRTVPEPVSDAAPTRLLRGVLDVLRLAGEDHDIGEQVDGEELGAPGKALQRVFAAMACCAATRRGGAVSEDWMRSLMPELQAALQLEGPYCHPRLTLGTLIFEDLESRRR